MINLRFRPSLVVFVNEEGQQICEHLRQIVQLTCFDEILHEGIALVQVTAREERDPGGQAGEVHVRIERAERVPIGRGAAPEEPSPRDATDLHNVISASIDRIQADALLSEISRERYPVPETRPQIYIVGSARCRALREIHHMLQQEVRRRFFATEICYILDAFDQPGQGDVLVADDLALPKQSDPYWLREDVPNFCFFYEKYLAFPNPRTVTREESHYAAAESLFALISTGITPEPRFENFVQPPPRLTMYTNVGSMNTTLLIFPREAALTFASARLGSTLLEQWLSDLNRELLPEKQRRTLQGRARQDVVALEDWLEERECRPGANEEARAVSRRRELEPGRGRNNWPTLHVLREEHPAIPARTLTQQQETLRDLEDQSVALFRLFHFREIEHEVRRYRRRPDIWVRLVEQRGRRAVEAYYEWNQIASAAWEAAGARAQSAAQYEIDTLWSNRQHGIHGFEMARTYVDAFDERLVTLHDHMQRLRVSHQQNYIESLEHFEQVSEGEWLGQTGITDAAGDTGAPAQASPQMSRPAATFAPVGAGGGGSGVASAGAAGHQHLSLREVQLVDRLERRILWLQDQLPSIPTQIATSLPFLLALVLAWGALYPQGGALMLVALTVGVGLLLGLANWIFWRRYWKKVREARKDLLRFYVRHFAHRCEVREDALRLLVTTPLRRRVMGLRERLDDIASFIGSVRTRLDTIAQRTQHDLFDTPSGARDIYVANGERLQRRSRNTLEDLAHQVTQQRENRPLEPWHRSLLEIRENLIEAFRTERPSILEMNEDDACTRIETFVRGVTRGYLHGTLDDIQRALANSAIWSEARDRACSPLYQAVVGMRQPQLFFVCGQAPLLAPLSADQMRGKSRTQMHWPVDAIPVYISDHHDWVLFAAFFSGGTPPALDSEILFPPKRRIDPADWQPEAIRPLPEDLDAHSPLADADRPWGAGGNAAPAPVLSAAESAGPGRSWGTGEPGAKKNGEASRPPRGNGLPEVCCDAQLNVFLQGLALHSIGIKGAQQQMEQYLALRRPTPAQQRAWEQELGILSKSVFQDPNQARQKRAVQAIHGVLRDAVAGALAADNDDDDTPGRLPAVRPGPSADDEMQQPPPFDPRQSWP